MCSAKGRRRKSTPLLSCGVFAPRTGWAAADVSASGICSLSALEVPRWLYAEALVRGVTTVRFDGAYPDRAAVFPWRSSSGAHRRHVAAMPLCTASPLRFDCVRLWPLVFGVKRRPGGNCWRDGQNTHLGVRLFGSGRRLGSWIACIRCSEGCFWSPLDSRRTNRSHLPNTSTNLPAVSYFGKKRGAIRRIQGVRRPYAKMVFLTNSRDPCPPIASRDARFCACLIRDREPMHCELNPIHV